MVVHYVSAALSIQLRLMFGVSSVLMVLGVYLFNENLSTQRMLEIYKTALIKFGEDTTSWVLQDDGDRKHPSNLCTTWKGENAIQILD